MKTLASTRSATSMRTILQPDHLGFHAGAAKHKITLGSAEDVGKGGYGYTCFRS